MQSLSENDYLKYLSKFKSEFKVEENDSNMLIIKGKYGQIEPYGYDQLQVWFRKPQENEFSLSTNRLKKLYEAALPYLTYLAELDGEGLGRFYEKYLTEIVKLIGGKKKRVATENQLAHLKRIRPCK